MTRMGGEILSLFPALLLVAATLAVIAGILATGRRRTLRELEACQRALGECDARFRAVFEAAPLGMGLFTAGGAALETNARGRGMLGLAPGAALDPDTLLRCIHPGDAERARHFYERALRGESDPPLECRWRMPDGQLEWARASASIARGETGDVRFLVGTVELVTARKDAEERIKALAFFDGVTGLANRSLFMDRFARALALAQKRHHPLAVLFLDLDGFKQVNDRHGHEVGDEVLSLVAERFASSVRLSDQIGRVPDQMHVSRFGGDEFTVLLSRLQGDKGAEIVARRLLKSLERPLDVEGLSLQLGVSIGIALYPEDGDSVDELLRHADAAMYRAKRDPGSAFRFYEAGSDPHR